jgi:hypothetical protein
MKVIGAMRRCKELVELLEYHLMHHMKPKKALNLSALVLLQYALLLLLLQRRQTQSPKAIGHTHRVSAATSAGPEGLVCSPYGIILKVYVQVRRAYQGTYHHPHHQTILHNTTSTCIS